MTRILALLFISLSYGSETIRVDEIKKQSTMIAKQLEQINSAINKIESLSVKKQTPDIDINSITSYFGLATECVLIMKDQFIKLIYDLELLLEILRLISKTVTIYFILLSAGIVWGYVLKRLIVGKNNFVSTVLKIFAQIMPELLCSAFYYIPGLLSFLQLQSQYLKILDFEAGLIQYFHFFSQVSTMFLIGKGILAVIGSFKGSEAFSATIKPLLLNIILIKVFKITLNAFILITRYDSIINFDSSINQIEIAVTFLIVTYFIFKLRDLTNFKNIHIRSIVKYISLPIIFSAVFAYLSNSNEASFIYKLLLSLSVMPILNKFYSVLRYFLFSYVKSLSKHGIRHALQAFLLTMNTFKFLLIPCSMVIMTAIFGINLIYEIHAFFGGKFIYRLVTLSLLIFVFRIGLILNIYFWSISEQVNISKRPFDKQRIQTFSIIIKNTSSTFIIIIAAFVFLSLLGVDISPLFQSVGVLSAALSFSMQEFIRDIFNGLFILYDNSIKVGDLIEYDKKTAIVEVMHLRYVRIRFDDGLLITIPFHKLDLIRNKSRQQSYIILNISFARNVEIKAAEDAIEEAFNNIRDKPEFKYKILKDIELRDLAEVTAFSYVMQCRVCVQPNSQYKIKRALNRELKIVLDKYNIDLAFPPVANAINSPSLSTGDSFPDFQ